jgi:hypothetical protein
MSPRDEKRIVPFNIYDEGLEGISAFVGLPLQLLRGQGTVDEKEKKYVAGISPNVLSSLAGITFDRRRANTISTFFKSLLE